MNTIDSYIDFLKGVLRIDKDARWTPSQAMEHPFITREQWSGPFEPRQEPSAHGSQGGVDTMS
jgi:hypothetical protein